MGNAQDSDQVEPVKESLVSKTQFVERNRSIGLFPVSHAQLRLWLVDQMNPNSPAYNISIGFIVSGPIDVTALQKSVAEISRRHDVLRTKFVGANGAVEQAISDFLDPHPVISDISELLADKRRDEVIRIGTIETQMPFNLAEGPLFRFKVVKMSDIEHALFLTMHHIIADGWSVGIFLHELNVLYEAYLHGKQSALPELHIQYSDYVSWQHRWLKGEAAGRQLRFWMQELAGELPAFRLGADSMRRTDRSEGSDDGALDAIKIDLDLLSDLRRVTRRHKSTLFMTLLTAINVALYRLSGSTDSVVGTPIAGRSRPEIQKLIGPFTNTLALRSKLDPEFSFADALRATREMTLNAYSNQDLPFDTVVSHLRTPRIFSRNPVFDFMFALQNGPQARLNLANTSSQVLPVSRVSAALDIGIQLTEYEGGIEGALGYRPSRFRHATIADLKNCFLDVLESVRSGSYVRVGESSSPAMPSRKILAHPLGQSQARYLRQELLPALDEVLRSHPFVEDFAILLRENILGATQLVAYVVPKPQSSIAELRSTVQRAVRDNLASVRVVRVTNLPYDASGELDERILSLLPVLDPELEKRCESELQSQTGAESVVVSQEDISKTPPLHMSDVEPGGTKNLDGGDAKRATVECSPTAVAICHGESLKTLSYCPQSLPMLLERAAGQDHKTGLTYWEPRSEEVKESYGELKNNAEILLRGLRRIGLVPKDRVIFQFGSNQDFLHAFWACILGGFIPVPIGVAPNYDRPNRSVSSLKRAWEVLDHPVILTSEEVKAAIVRSPEFKKLDSLRVVAISELHDGVPDTLWHKCHPDDVALMLLTSGSTSEPKVIQLSHRNILTRSAGTEQMNGFSQTDVSLNWMPLDHVGGLVMFHLMDTYTGCRQVHIPTQMVLENVLVWMDAMDRYKATITWAPNFAFRLVNDRASAVLAGHWNLSSMRFVLDGGEAINPHTANTFLTLLGRHGLRTDAMHPAWGMSETTSGVTFSASYRREATGEPRFVSVGKPIPGCSIRVVDELSTIVNETTIGRVQVKGPMVTSGYYANPNLNRQVFDRDGWFDTGDLGFISDGSLTITGRHRDVVIINGQNYYSHEIEARVEDVAGVESSYTAAFAVRSAGSDTDQLAVFFVSALPEPEIIALVGKVRAHLLDTCGVNPDYLLSVEKSEIPKTVTGKIQRSLLKTQLEEGKFVSRVKQFDLDTTNRNTVPDCFHEFEWRPKKAKNRGGDTQNESYLIFADTSGFGLRVRNELPGRCVVVEQGDGFVQLGSDHFKINTRNGDDYVRLFSILDAIAFRPDTILHLPLCDGDGVETDELRVFDQLQDRGLYSILLLIQGFVKAGARTSMVRLCVVTSDAQSTKQDEPQRCGASSIASLLRTVPLEMEQIECLHIDFRDSDDMTTKCQSLLKELHGSKDSVEVAYRGNQRLIPFLAKVDILSKPISKRLIVPGGRYLITGGLGGIGAGLARFLVQVYGAKVLSVGRTVLPDSQLSRDSVAPGSPLGKKISRYHTLTSLGPNWTYEAVDSCDRVAMQSVVSKTEANWNASLDAVFHLAGEGQLATHWRVADNHRIVSETPATFEWMSAPKVHAARVLCSVFDQRRELPIVYFSSVNSIFGGATFSAYSAANRSMDSYVRMQRLNGRTESYLYHWSMWDNVGMSEGNPPQANVAAEALGFSVLTHDQGMVALVGGLNRGLQDLVIGVQQENWHLRSRIATDCRSVDCLVAHVQTGSDGVAATTYPDSIETIDEYGVRTSCDVRQVRELPLTQSGQIDRLRLEQGRQNSEAGDQMVARAGTNLERRVGKLWEELLGVSNINTGESFFELGGHSLLATQLIARINSFLQIELPLRTIFEAPTLEGFCKAISQASGNYSADQKPPLVPAARVGGIPLSYAQERLWFLDRLQGSSSEYNMSEALRLLGLLDKRAFDKAIQAMISRHESLRTHFSEVDGLPLQFVDTMARVEIPFEDLSHLAKTEQSERIRLELRREAERPFNLSQSPMMRVKLLKLRDREHLMLRTMHHIVSDAISENVFSQEFSAFYECYSDGRPASLRPLPIQYADYAVWEKDWLGNDVLNSSLKYWTNQLAGIPDNLNLPTDRPRPSRQTFEAEEHQVVLPSEQTALLNRMASEGQSTLYMVLLATFGVLLGRYTGQDDLVIGSPIANRQDALLENLIGFFVNSLALRVQVRWNETFRELLTQVRKTTLDAYQHQSVPFGKVVERVAPRRRLDRTPLYQVVMALQNTPWRPQRLKGLEIVSINSNDLRVRTDIEVHIREDDGRLLFKWLYSRDLFDRWRIEQMASHFSQMLNDVTVNPDRPLKYLKVFDIEKAQQDHDILSGI